MMPPRLRSRTRRDAFARLRPAPEPLEVRAVPASEVQATLGAAAAGASADAPGSTVSGRVFLDRNADEIQEDGEPNLPGRVVFVSLDGSGTYKPSDPSATTDADGQFALAGVPAGAGLPMERLDQDDADRYAVSPAATVNDQVTIGVVPYSPILPASLNPTFVVVNRPSGLEGYVQSLFNVVLGRNGSLAELTAWDDAIAAQSLKPADIAERFVDSAEHRTEEVAGYYRDFLGRDPDPLAQGWVDLLLAGAGEQAVVDGILASPEYQQAQGRSDAGTYVRDLYLDVLGRRAGDAEVAAWTDALSSGAARSTVAAEIVGSPEAADQLVTSLYVNILRRQPEGTASSDTWVDRLVGGTPAADVELGLLASPEFQLKTVGSLGSGS